MTKPLARSQGDEDLERLLKQERGKGILCSHLHINKKRREDGSYQERKVHYHSSAAALALTSYQTLIHVQILFSPKSKL